jgi:hypothetical protein
VALREALVVIYWAVRSKLQRRIRMVIKIAGEPSVFFFHCQLETKPSDSALKLTLWQVARVLDWAYPANLFRGRGKRLTMVVVI